MYVDVSEFIKLIRPRWVEHFLAICNVEITRKVLNAQSEGKKERGRPKLCCMNDFQIDVKVIGLRNCRMAALIVINGGISLMSPIFRNYFVGPLMTMIRACNLVAS